jgi:alpha-D-ribose 1-methylphosphonate 5-triphosphate diphosphatase PhnM
VSDTIENSVTFRGARNILSVTPSQLKADGGLTYAAAQPHDYPVVGEPDFVARFEASEESSPAEAQTRGKLVFVKAPYLIAATQNSRVRDAFAKSMIDVVVADSYAPSLLYAAFFLDGLGIMALNEAVNLMSLRPAQLLGLSDTEGSLEAGKVANLCLVEVWEGIPRVVRTIVGGKTCFAAGNAAKSKETA